MVAALVLLLAQVAGSAPAGPPPGQGSGPGLRAAPTAISGTVRDLSGSVVPNATITVRNGSKGEQTVTGPDGRFTVNAAATSEIVLVVRAAGFAELRHTVSAGSSPTNIDIVLSPASVQEAVTVTATRSEQRTGDVPASVSVLDREDIKQSPALVADDLLRQIPTFSLFRRTSSLASHPTAQGVSLRGIGPSGVSRTLVLVDGVPNNDPFGGWVYWSRVPLESSERIEVVDGSTSSLYGNYAMGGVINFVTNPATPKTLDVKAQYGNRSTPKVDFRGSHVWGKLGVTVDGNVFNTDGYYIVRENERGRVDNRAAAEFWNLNLKLDYTPSDRVHAFARIGYFDENRDNGKASTIDGTEEANDTIWRAYSGGVRARMPDQSELQATVFTDFETFHSNFLAVPAANPPRSIGRMTLTQKVPTHSAGGMVQWSRAFGTKQYFTAGSDLRWVDGDSLENGLDAQTGTTVVLLRDSGGTQRNYGFFVQDLITPTSQLVLTLSARVDGWRNYEGHNLETSLIGAPVNNVPSLPDRSDTVASPRAAARYHLTDRLDVWGDIGWGFRTPTLNELYRQFRVGTTLTLANYNLGPERLTGGEAGASFAITPNSTVRATWFDNHIKDPVSNVTISQVGNNVTQQRQNLGKTHVRGIQTDVEYHFASDWRVAAAYVYDQAKVTENPTTPALVGKWLPQVPEHRGSLRLAYSNARMFTASAGVQFVGSQFDDDLNTPSRRLPDFAVVDIIGSRAVGRNFEFFAGVQNLFNAEYFVGTLPTTVGTPRLITAGIRVTLR
ncbi:MAG TPA: TonB-dependent receptor [Vicinamibacterales bacterium]|jgi:outer membrane receptor protein involved in Fe transport|nr:TonB-dependent receptor [Vicinamibacterales bacterium]